MRIRTINEYFVPLLDIFYNLFVTLGQTIEVPGQLVYRTSFNFFKFLLRSFKNCEVASALW